MIWSLQNESSPFSSFRAQSCLQDRISRFQHFWRTPAPDWISSCLLSHPELLFEGMGFPGTLDALNTAQVASKERWTHTVPLQVSLSGSVGQPWSSAEALGSQLFPTAGNYIYASSCASQISKRSQVLPRYSSRAKITAWEERSSTGNCFQSQSSPTPIYIFVPTK